jgi:hypothetical protein
MKGGCSEEERVRETRNPIFRQVSRTLSPRLRLVDSAMDPSTPMEFLTRQEYAEATVLRIGLTKLVEGADLEALRQALSQEAERGDRALILDLAAVQYVGSAAIGFLITLRRKLLAQRGRPSYELSRRWWVLSAYFRDEAEALAAVRDGELDVLLLCGVHAEILEVFRLV